EIRRILGPQIRPDRDERQIERQTEGLAVMGSQGGGRHRLAAVHATAVFDQDLDQRVELLTSVAALQCGDDEAAERRERTGLAPEESTDVCHGIAVNAAVTIQDVVDVLGQAEAGTEQTRLAPAAQGVAPDREAGEQVAPVAPREQYQLAHAKRFNMQGG